MHDEPLTVLEAAHWRVVLSEDQELLGRCVVICRDAVSEMGQLTSEQWQDFGSVARLLEAAAKDAFGATMCNWTCLMNSAYRHHPPNPQVHWHFRPRYEQTVRFAGLEFVDAAFGSHYPRGTDRTVGGDVLQQIVEAYRRALGPARSRGILR